MSKDPTFFEYYTNNILLDPVDLKRNILLMLRVFYSNSKHYGPLEKELENIYYKSGDPKSILALDLGLLEGDEHSKLNITNIPSILVFNTDWNFAQTNVGNRLDRPINMDNERFRKAVTTSIVVKHFMRSADEASLFGTLTAGFFLGILEEIKNSWNLNKFEVENLTAPKLVSNNNEQETVYQVDVFIKMNFNFLWEQYIDTKLIKTISFSSIKEL